MQLIGGAGVEGTWGNGEPEGRCLAGFDPDAGTRPGHTGPVRLVARRDDAIWFPGRGQAGACWPAAPAGALPGPGGTPNRPLSVSRVAGGPEPAGLAPAAENPQHQGLPGQLDLDGAA